MFGEIVIAPSLRANKSERLTVIVHYLLVGHETSESNPSAHCLYLFKGPDNAYYSYFMKPYSHKKLHILPEKKEKGRYVHVLN